MKANIQFLTESTRNIDSYRRSKRRLKGFCREIAAICPSTGRVVVTARFYYPTSVAYCCVWIHGENKPGTGRGKAGGYGYHKESAALADALGDAGVILDESISGHGNRAMIDAIEAVARAVTGKRKFIIYEAHA